MTLVMAEKDQPVFRDFLGLSHRDPADSKPPPELRRAAGLDCGESATVSGHAFAASPRGGVTGRFESSPGFLSPPFGPSPEPGAAVGWQQGKPAASLQHHGNRSAFSKPDFDASKAAPRKRDSPSTSPGGRESLQERLQMSVEALENSRPHKVARLEHQRSLKRGEYGDAAPSAVDELRLSMQPPRPASSNPLWMQQPDIPRSSKRPSPRPLHATPPAGPMTPQQLSPQIAQQIARISHLGACAEREERMATGPREFPPVMRPAADEGSRTGLKGSSPLAGLITTPAAAAAPTPAGSNGPPPVAPPRRPKVPAQSGGSGSMIPSLRQAPPPASRQLTIFYGGQAHVFDDVPPDKADAILGLAGSNGRSWSTTYSPRPSASAPNSASEGSLSVLDRERDKTVQSVHSRGAASEGGSLALSSEVQTLLRGLAQSGISTARPVGPIAAASPWSTSD